MMGPRVRVLCAGVVAASAFAFLALFASFRAFAGSMPSAQLLKRIAEGPEIIAILHFGPNTYTDLEWGFGDADPAIFNPAAFDADQIVGAAKAGGVGGIVMVAKHHDGFCLWPTATTEYNITKTPFWKGTGRDLVKEIEQACRRAGLKFGIYVSPWDRNNAAYGSPQYVEIYHNQFKELCAGAYGEIFEAWFDGANGGDGWYGGAKEKRRIPADYYRFDELHAWLRAAQPGITFMGTKAKARDFNWPKNEKGIVPSDSHNDGGDGVFRMFEADFPLRRGWFYHERDKGQAKSGKSLAKIYFTSVGRGGTMNIGIAPDKNGLVCDEDVRKLREFKRIIDRIFSHEASAGEPCNIVALKENLADGEKAGEWELLCEKRTVAKGRYIGAKRIAVLDAPVSGEITLKCGGGAEVSIRRYLAPEKLLREVLGSAAAQETDTAKRMHNGAEDGQ